MNQKRIKELIKDFCNSELKTNYAFVDGNHLLDEYDMEIIFPKFVELLIEKGEIVEFEPVENTLNIIINLSETRPGAYTTDEIRSVAMQYLGDQYTSSTDINNKYSTECTKNKIT